MDTSLIYVFDSYIMQSNNRRKDIPMGTTIKVVIGIIIIIASFIYILKNRSQSMMDALMKKRREDMEKALAELGVKAADEELAINQPQSQDVQEAPADAAEEITDSEDLRI